MVLEVTDSNFDEEVISSQIPVLVDFWAEWCGPCRLLAPVVENVATEMAGKIKVVKLDIENNPEKPSFFGVRSIPTLMLFQNGKVVAVRVGSVEKEFLIDWINESLKS